MLQVIKEKILKILVDNHRDKAVDEIIELLTQHPAGVNRWVKASEFKYELEVIYHAKFSDTDKGAGYFNDDGGGGHIFVWQDGADTFQSMFHKLLILNESPNEQPVVNNALNKDNARYELRLALRSVLKILKLALGDNMSKHQKERYDAAEAMLKKHSNITDVLRTESNEQPVEQKENEPVDIFLWAFVNIAAWDKDSNMVRLYNNKKLQVSQLYNEYQKQKNEQ